MSHLSQGPSHLPTLSWEVVPGPLAWASCVCPLFSCSLKQGPCWSHTSTPARGLDIQMGLLLSCHLLPLSFWVRCSFRPGHEAPLCSPGCAT